MLVRSAVEVGVQSRWDNGSCVNIELLSRPKFLLGRDAEYRKEQAALLSVDFGYFR